MRLNSFKRIPYFWLIIISGLLICMVVFINILSTPHSDLITQSFSYNSPVKPNFPLSSPLYLQSNPASVSYAVVTPEPAKITSSIISVVPTPTVIPTCLPRPACLDSTPRCLIAEPVNGWCNHSSSPAPVPSAPPSPPSPIPHPTCLPRPVCLDHAPYCEIAEPISGWCQPLPTPIALPSPLPSMPNISPSPDPTLVPLPYPSISPTCLPRPVCLDGPIHCMVMQPLTISCE